MYTQGRRGLTEDIISLLIRYVRYLFTSYPKQHFLPVARNAASLTPFPTEAVTPVWARSHEEVGPSSLGIPLLGADPGVKFETATRLVRPDSQFLGFGPQSESETRYRA